MFRDNITPWLILRVKLQFDLAWISETSVIFNRQVSAIFFQDDVKMPIMDYFDLVNQATIFKTYFKTTYIRNKLTKLGPSRLKPYECIY